MNQILIRFVVLPVAIGIPCLAGTIYSNGPETSPSSANAYAIDGAYSISDGFVPTLSGVVSSFSFGYGPVGLGTPLSVSWALGTTPFGTDLGQGTATASTNLSYVYLFTVTVGTQSGDYYESTVSGVTANLIGGDTYYLSLSNAQDSGGFGGSGWRYSLGPATCDYAISGVNQGACTGLLGSQSESFLISGTVITPEPGSVTLFASGLLAMVGLVSRKARRSISR